MLSLYLRPDRTQIMQAQWTKDKGIRIDETHTMDECLSYVIEPGQIYENKLQDFFKELKRETRISSEEVNIVLPDYIFSFIDSVENTDQVKVKAIVSERTGENPDALYIAAPMKQEPPSKDMQSVYAIKKEYIDRLVNVSMRERITLIAIEPASIAFFRSIGFAGWRREIPFVEMFPNAATIVTYSPAGGIFRQEAPMLAEKNLSKEGVNASNIVHQAFSANDYTVTQLFASFNTDMSYYTITHNKNLRNVPAIKMRLPEEPMEFPDYTSGKLPQKEEQHLWLCCFGGLLNAMDEVYTDSYENPVYKGKVSFIHLQSANLLPDTAKSAIQKRQWKQTIQRICRFLSAAMIILMLVEGAAIIFFSSHELKPELERDYKKAKQDISAIQSELDVIKIAEREEQRPVEAFAQLNSCLPVDCGITDISIGNGNVKSNQGNNSNKKNNDGKKDTKKAESATQDDKSEYITMQAIAKDELLLQNFNANLSNNETFANPFISNISAASNGMKIAKFTIGRGEQSE